MFNEWEILIQKYLQRMNPIENVQKLININILY
jgi:hypothetical protein